MTESTWRPLGVESEAQIASYDALHDNVPQWMSASLWDWVKDELKRVARSNSRYGGTPTTSTHLRVDLLEAMCQTLRVALPSMRGQTGESAVVTATNFLKATADALQVVDYLLAHKPDARADVLEALLVRSRSAWQVGTRAGLPGLTRRVPLGVQVASDDVMARSGQAGLKLARAWEVLYGIDPNPSEAYRLAIKAVEDAAIPVVSPTDRLATLGKVIKQLEDQSGWSVPMQREHDSAPSVDVVINMARMLWHGQHDRHGGQPSAPGDVSIEEATVAVSLAVSLVHLFTSGLVTRSA